MEIRVLKYFLLVAREENITKAANLLHLTQPTLSRQLMQLEEELGVQLFRRSKHRIVLTEDGMLLRRRAEEIVALADKTKDDLQHREGQLSGTVAVGSGELPLLFPRNWRSFSRRWTSPCRRERCCPLENPCG